MSLKDTLLQELKSAMKDRDEIKKSTIQLTRAAVLQVEKDNKVTLDDDGIIEIIAKEVKKRRDSMPEFEKSGRQDLIENLKAEMEVLSKYLPEQLSESELEEIVKQSVKEVDATSARDIGKVMQNVLPKVKGRADGKIINQMLKNILG